MKRKQERMKKRRWEENEGMKRKKGKKRDRNGRNRGKGERVNGHAYVFSKGGREIT